MLARAGRKDPEETSRALSAGSRALEAVGWGSKAQVQVGMIWGFRCLVGFAFTVALRGLEPSLPATVALLAMAMVARHLRQRRR